MEAKLAQPQHSGKTHVCQSFVFKVFELLLDNGLGIHTGASYPRDVCRIISQIRIRPQLQV